MGHHETVRLDKTGKQGRRNGKKNGEDKHSGVHNLPLPHDWNGTGLTNLLRYGEDQPSYPHTFHRPPGKKEDGDHPAFVLYPAKQGQTLFEVELEVTT
mgnify:CR=1 FL=1